MRIKNWKKHQHFKDRKPPWIKLYRDLLDDIEWHELEPKAAKALVMLWLIASENDGELPDIKRLAFRLRMTENEANSICSKLSQWLEHDDINVISERYQSDSVETETEGETKKEKETKRSAALAPPDGVSSSVWSDFLAVRKAKKAPMTLAALEGIQREAEKAGWKLEDALKECCTRGWQSFKADWVASKPQTHAQVAADVARVTVPARQGRDPVLEKIEQDALAAVKPSPEILARMAALRGH